MPTIYVIYKYDGCIHNAEAIYLLQIILNFYIYRKFPKYSDTQKFVVITLKFALCGSTIE